jgi:RNA polymerase sigma factor (sigma-70 family)
MAMAPGTWAQSTIDSTHLTANLRAGDERAWTTLDARYGPLVRACALDLGLAPHAADDVRQETMLAFLEALRAGRYDRTKGRPRDFLFGIARKKIMRMLFRERRQSWQVAGAAGQTSFFRGVPDPKAAAELWKERMQSAIAAQCMREAKERFSPMTYLLWYRRRVDGLSAQTVADETGKTLAAVNMAVHRVQEFLRRIEGIIAEAF